MRRFRTRWTLKWRLLSLFAAFALVETMAATASQVVRAQEFIEDEMVSAMEQMILLADRVMEYGDQAEPNYAVALGPSRAALQDRPIRHVALKILDRSGVVVLQTRPDENHWTPPGWFIALLDNNTKEWRREGSLGTIIVTADPQTEIAETWEDMVTVTGVVILLNIAMMLLVYVLVTRLLRPLHSFEASLKRLEQGDYDFAPDPGGIPELVRISDRLTSLRDSLGRLGAENHRLIRGLITVQDEERLTLAHEIHDGVGPYVFSIRVDAQGLIRAAETQALSPEDVATRGSAILGAAGAIQTLIRSMLKRLRPMALDHMQLVEVLTSMVDTWRRQHPDIAWDLSLDDGLERMDETANITLYHMVKEAGLNVIRHAQAETVWISMRRQSEGRSAEQIEVVVEDDGTGIGADKIDGIGLAGMRERVRALGGAISIGARSGGGTRLWASIPVGPTTSNGVSNHG